MPRPTPKSRCGSTSFHRLTDWALSATTTFGFAGESAPEHFNEGDRRWPISAGSFTGPYQLYSIDPKGRGVENSIVGGHSATEPDNHAEQFALITRNGGEVAARLVVKD